MLVLRMNKKNHCLEVNTENGVVLIKYNPKTKSMYIHGDKEVNIGLIESDIFRFGDDKCEPEHSGNTDSVSKDSES